MAAQNNTAGPLLNELNMINLLFGGTTVPQGAGIFCVYYKKKNLLVKSTNQTLPVNVNALRYHCLLTTDSDDTSVTTVQLSKE